MGQHIVLRLEAALVAACLALFAAGATVSAIPVENFSFEDPDLGHDPFPAERFSVVAPPGWSGVGAGPTAVGAFDPWEDNYTGTTPPVLPSTADGAQTAYMNLPAGFSNSLTYSGFSLGNFTPGDTYTLTVAVGGRKDFGLPPDLYTITLLAAGVPVGTGASGPGIADTFYDLSYSFTATVFQAGQPIGIRLSASNTSASFEQANMDNVRLVPEPASLAVAALGALMSLRRRARA